MIVETTSIAVLNWMNIDKLKFHENIKRGIEFIKNRVKKGGCYGSTQGTILALKALVQYNKEFGGINGKGKLVLRVNGKEVSSRILDQHTSQNIEFSEDMNDFMRSCKQTEIEVAVCLENFTPTSKNAETAL